MDIDLSFVVDWLAASVRLSTPLILASIGGVYTERTGIFNLGIEGMMLAGALASVAGSYFTGSVLCASGWAMVAGGLLALFHAYLTINRRADQIVSGMVMNFLALGLTNMLFARIFPAERVRVEMYPILSPESWREIPILGPIILAQPVIVWISILLAIAATWILYRTTWGLNIRAVGDHPRAVATAGVSVNGLKFSAVLVSGAFAGLAGSALVLSDIGYYSPNMTAGRGFIVLAALVVGKWNPIMAAAACLLFGCADALQLRFQTFGFGIPFQFPTMTPYILTVLALAGFVGRTAAPKTLCKPYDPENY